MGKFFTRDIPPFEHFRITATTSGTILSGPGMLHTVTINDIETTGALALYDDTNLVGGLIASIRVTGDRGVFNFPQTAVYDISLGTGLTYDMSGLGDITVTYLR